MATLVQIKVVATAICNAERGATDARVCAFGFLRTGKPCCDVCGTYGAKYAEAKARAAIVALEQVQEPEPRKGGWFWWLRKEPDNR